MSKYCYLSYWFNLNGGKELNMERRIAKGVRMMGRSLRMIGESVYGYLMHCFGQ